MGSLLRVFMITDESVYAEAREYCVARALGEESDSEDQARKLESVREIVTAVRRRGDEAVAEFTERFDGVRLRPDEFELSASELDAAIEQVDKNLIAALERAHENIRRFHSKHLRQSWEETLEDGTLLGQRITPIDSAGVYVPGGKAFYPTSVLMNIVPAKVAKVQEIIMVSPPSYNGSIHPLVLAAARIAGATRVFRVGGAQSIAALAYGTATIPAVSKITGPGNIYVTLAKRLVNGVCSIDMEAGPSEVAVIADDKANPTYVAAELVCQAEHDEDAVVSLVTPSSEMANLVEEELVRQLEGLPRAEIARKALQRHGAVFVVRNLEEAADLINFIAPEHLSIQVDIPMKLFDKIHHAGAVMIGGNTPVAVGDYYAGPNHILPTGRRARFSSALHVEDFRKTTNFMMYSRERIRRDAEDIMLLAEAEGLPAHARAVELRR